MINNETDEVIKEAFYSLKSRHQNNLESMKGSKFIVGYIHLLYNKCHKINPNHDGSCIDSVEWIESSIRCNSLVKSTRNKKTSSKNKKKNQPVINKNNWEGRNFSSKKGD